MAAVQLRNTTEGRAYYDRRKAVSETSMEAISGLKRRLSPDNNIVFRTVLADAELRAARPEGDLRARLCRRGAPITSVSMAPPCGPVAV